GGYDPVAHVVEDRAQQPAMAFGGFFGLLGGGDVAHDGEHGRPAVQLNCRGVDVYRNDATVLGAMASLALEVAACTLCFQPPGAGGGGRDRRAAKFSSASDCTTPATLSTTVRCDNSRWPPA